MSSPDPSELVVVIPVRGRYDALQRVLAGLATQDVAGFETVVVVDGTDIPPPPVLAGVRVEQVARAGPGAARDVGVARTDRPYLLFLGADMVPAPALVRTLLAAHDGAETTGVLGHVDWAPDVAGIWENGWLERTGFQFDFASIAGGDAGWQRFYSCNVLLTRALFDRVGGFGDTFPYYYEDVDMALRLRDAGLVLRYAPTARAAHVHAYDRSGLRRRFHGMGRGEEQLLRVHPAAHRLASARLTEKDGQPPRSSCWIAIDRRSAHLPLPGRVAAAVRHRADLAQWQDVAPWFFDGVDGERDLAELREYLGDEFDQAALDGHRAAVDAEEHAAASEDDFYRTSRAYLYDLTAFSLEAVKVPYRTVVRKLAPAPARLLDYGCGIGTDGLRFLDRGYAVDFADFVNPSTEYLRWRLARRGSDARVHDIDAPIAGGYDLAYSFDVIEHVQDPFAFLARMELAADIVVVNLLEEDPGDTHLHKPLPIEEIVGHARARGLLHRSLHYGRSHLIAYRSRRSDRLSRSVVDQVRGALRASAR